MRKTFLLLLFIVTLSHSSVFTQLRSPLVENGFSFNFEGFLTRRTYLLTDTLREFESGIGYVDTAVVEYFGTSYSDITAELSVGFRKKFMISTSIKPMRAAIAFKINLTDRGDYSSLFRNFACGGYIGGAVNLTDALFDIKNEEIQDLCKLFVGLSISTRKELSETGVVELICNPTVSTGTYHYQIPYNSSTLFGEIATTECALPIGLRFSKKKRAVHFFTASLTIHAISPLEYSEFSESFSYKSTPPVIALGYGFRIPSRRHTTKGEKR